jgi:hypothetical protein
MDSHIMSVLMSVPSKSTHSGMAAPLSDDVGFAEFKGEDCQARMPLTSGSVLKAWTTCMKRVLDRPGAIFLLVFVWKAILLLVSAQPVPANDSFFCDGPVVHFLNHGGYFNPPVAQSRPFSGTEFFCAYPPLYQIVLLGWMKIFGTSALAAMWFHLAIFGAYELAVLAIFRALNVPARAGNLAGLFLLAITFDDKSDSLACLLGTLGILGAIRWQRGAHAGAWLAAAFSVLGICASLQVGALCSLWIFLALAIRGNDGQKQFPIAPLAAMVLTPLALAAVVRFGFPVLWAGFMENVQCNASLTGWHWPRPNEPFKAARNVPGLLIVAGLLLVTSAGRERLRRFKEWNRGEIILVTAVIAGGAYTTACMFLVAANWILAINYLQPVIVGIFLASAAAYAPQLLASRATGICLALVVALISIRAVGISTWGVACSVHDSYASARARVAKELEPVPPGANVLVSSAFLYEADRHTNANWIHEDYPYSREEREDFLAGMRRLRVSKLVLTQYDYYRRYEKLLQEAHDLGGMEFSVTNSARVRTPDSYPALRRVLQHISWAPVVVNLHWQP